ncbi:uncharacterized protein TNCT_569401 [Trichonephila clavata]|uniref:Uncharacterized protein n=1 Tax=Trichonephila clavata TaxID=2740835 RepID=A0A8X6LBY6_TRICU|nr:uncharacterized protein TNCT_569401 [Trichonephila clavata]
MWLMLYFLRRTRNLEKKILSEQVVKILDTTDVCSLVFIAQKGTVVYRNLRLQEEAKFHWDLCSDLQKQKSRKALFKVTDASYLNVSRHYCLSTTNRSLNFIHASPSAQWETFRLTDFPTVPTCLENNFQPTNKTKTCELFIGDHKGNIYMLKFFYPRTLLFARNYSLGTQVISFQVSIKRFFRTRRVATLSHSIGEVGGLMVINCLILGAFFPSVSPSKMSWGDRPNCLP